MGRTVIEFENATYSYGTRALWAATSLTLEAGSFHFLIGPSGAGKTTLLRMCYGDLVPTSGAVRLFGTDRAAMDRDAVALTRRRIGVVYQDCQFLDHLDVVENVALPLTVAGRRPSEQSQDLTDLLDWVGLSQHKSALPPQLSGGERQRVALARAIITSPDVVLADEPTGNVDWEMSLRLLQLLIELNRMGKTIVVATHDLALIRAAKSQVSGRVLRISGGQVQYAGADL